MTLAPGKARCIRPDHHDSTPSMWIYENGVYCFGCGATWKPDQFLRELGDRELITIPVRAPRKARPSQHIPYAMVTTFNSWLNKYYRDRLDWLYARGLRLEDSINPNLLGYDGSAYVIPVLDDRNVQALRFRRDDAWSDSLEDTPESPKYWGMQGRNQVTLFKPVIPHWVPVRSDYVHLCEGELDALRLAQEGFPAWSLTNGCKSFRPEHEEAFKGFKVKVVYDQDPAGRQASQYISRWLGARQIIWPEVLGKDVTEFLQRWSLQAFMKHL